MDYNVNSLDGVDTGNWKHSLCCICKHFKGREKGSCEAYPKGIPSKYNGVDDIYVKHEVVDKYQTGNFTFEKKVPLCI